MHVETKIGENTSMPETYRQGPTKWLVNVFPKELCIQLPNVVVQAFSSQNQMGCQGDGLMDNGHNWWLWNEQQGCEECCHVEYSYEGDANWLTPLHHCS